MHTLMLENFNLELRSIVQLVSPESLKNLLETGVDEVICIDELKMSILAQSCVCPGIMTLFDTPCAFPAPGVKIEPHSEEHRDWMRSTRRAASSSVLRPLPDVLRGLTFREAALLATARTATS